MKAISSAYPNRNNSYFTKEAMEKAIPTFYNKPILGSFDVNQDDFRGHEGELAWDNELEQYYFDYTDSDSEAPLGLIRSEDKVEMIQDSSGLYWIQFSCALWVKYSYKMVKRLLKSKNGKKKISVEVEVNDYYIDENGIEVITDFTFDGVTILSDKLETGIADAEMTILDRLEDLTFKKKQQCLTYAYNSLNSKKNNFEDVTKENPVNNEEKEEITMIENQEGGEQQLLTYNAKRDLIEGYLNEKYNEEKEYYIWIADLDEEYIYFSYAGNYYKCNYTISEDEDDKVFVDWENKERVVRSWSVFQEMPCEEDHCNMENIDDIADEAGIKMTKECEGCQEQPESFENNEGKKECQEKDSDDSDDSDDGDDNDDNDEDLKEKYGELCKDYNLISENYEALKNSFEDINQKYQSLLSKVEEEKQNALLNFSYSLIDNEDCLNQEKKDFIKNQVKEESSTNKFENEDSIKKFTINLLAVAVYEQKKNIQEKDFSMDINTPQKKLTSYEEMAESAKKLRNI